MNELNVPLFVVIQNWSLEIRILQPSPDSDMRILGVSSKNDLSFKARKTEQEGLHGVHGLWLVIDATSPVCSIDRPLRMTLGWALSHMPQPS